MRSGDYPEVRVLWEKADGVGLGESDTPEAIAIYLERNPDLSLVALRQGRLVGAVLCGHDGRRGYLHHLAVEAAARKQGIGRALVEACLANLDRCGIPKCNIFLFADNEEGRRFWNRLGWQSRPDLSMLQCQTHSKPVSCGRRDC